MYREVVLIPLACNFGGVCDRIAIGLPSAMDSYFGQDLAIQVLNWAVNTPEEVFGYQARAFVMYGASSFSEHVLNAWFAMNNLTQIQIDPPQMSFITLRTAWAQQYCSSNRKSFVNNETLFWADRVMAFLDIGKPESGLDLIASPLKRCGAQADYDSVIKACSMVPACGCAEEISS
jgi:hypothetical protein